MTGLRKRVAVIAAICALSGGVVATPAVLANGSNQTYLILYQTRAVPSDAATRISTAGGTLVARYNAIGVAVATSSSTSFEAKVEADNRVAAASATGRTAVRLFDEQAGNDSATVDIPATGADNLSPLQWDMRQIHTTEAHAITGGDPSVVVGDIDTGLDYTHPDLAANVDFGSSVSCIGGVPNTDPAAWKDDNGHGTHTAGTIAAASNGIGIVGVAPNVKIAGIKAGNGAGFFFPEAVVCAFMWAGAHHLDVTNNSYFADPWLFNCKNDAEQRAIFTAEQRAIRYAESQGVVVVAAEGNQSDDLAHPTQDATSPDDTTPMVRDITNACAVVPVEVPGVVGVTADGNLGIKSFYSSYGMGAVQVIAPGGDSILQRTAAAPNGRVLSTWPAGFPCTRPVSDGSATYCYLQGTSMASPHVAGVAALIRSQHPGWAPGAVTARITSTADPNPCPDISLYAPFPAVDGGAPQVCQGGTGYNSFSGHGQVNAWAAVR
jgi:subtilisin family serine protease